MKSWDLVFTGPRQAEFSQQVIDAPKPGEIQCRACLSLVSAGTEERCLNGVFDEGTNWKSWVQYPFKPGYSMLAYVVAVGDGVVGFKPGDRVFAHAPHCQCFNIDARKANLVPEYIKRKSQVINSFIRDTAQVFKTYGVKVALETVCGDYTDYLMYLRQSAEVCGDSEESNIYLLTDIRHLVRAGDEPNDILKYRQKIIHAHIDNPINERRFAPMPDDGYNYEFFVRRVLQTGAEWISYECHDEVDWYVSGPASLDYIRSLVGKIEMEKAGLPLE